jgi:hypothetical protein
MKVFLILLLLASSIITNPSLADTKTIRIICTDEYLVDRNGKTIETSGDELITIQYTTNGAAHIKKQSIGALFVGTITDEEIHGITDYTAFNNNIRQEIIINRYTGKFTLISDYRNNNTSTMSTGTCRQTSEPKF